MEAQTSSCSSATNWIVHHGSLENSISFESSISSIDEEIDGISKDYLLLKPSSLDSGPCEIKISFTQRHEVRQVYVRSTARVYEIYYAPDLQSNNEYLCTVRCGIAAKEDKMHNVIDIGEAIATHRVGSTELLVEEKVKNDSISGTNEDDWVEVKVPDSPLLDGKTSFLPKTIAGHMESSIQDFYEATAEITDASPCISLTLRLLSLQTKGCIHVEEVYIFADPVESTDSDQVGQVENSAGSSLMAMLVPTLLQLSKTGSGSIQDRRVSDISDIQRHRDGVLKATELTNPSIGRTVQEEKASMADQQEVTGATAKSESSMADGIELKMPEVTQANAESTRSSSSVGDRQDVKMQEVTRSTQMESGAQVLGTGHISDSFTKENDLTSSRLERVLDHLVCRVGRLEAFCLRFEENMLKPLTGIETRLQRLEQQLEVFTMRSQLPGVSCTRITAPEFSCNESESNSFYNDGSDNQGCGGSETAKEDTHLVESSSPNGDASGLVDNSESPSLVITAPEFSNGDDDDEDYNDGNNSNEDSEAGTKDCSTDKPSISIDDALASALVGFLSSASIKPSKFTQTLIVKAPDFPNEEDGNDNLASPRVSCERAADHATGVGEEYGTESIQDSNPTPCSTISLDNEMQVMKLPNEGATETIAEGAIVQDQLHENGMEQNILNQTTAQNSCDTARNSTEETCNKGTTSRGCTMDQLHKECKDNKDEIDESEMGVAKGTSIQSQHLVEADDERSPDATPKTAFACTDLAIAREVKGAGHNNGMSQNTLDHIFSPAVDFNLPLLDVEFVLQKNWNATSLLETLLNEMPETEAEVSCVKDGDDGAEVGEQHLQLLQDEEPLKVPTEADQLLVELDDLTVKTVIPSVIEGQLPLELSTSNTDEPFTSLI